MRPGSTPTWSSRSGCRRSLGSWPGSMLGAGPVQPDPQDRSIPMRRAILALILAAGCMSNQEQPPPPTSLPADVGTGRVAWFDITTTNLTKSKDFYGKLFDWKFKPLQGTDRRSKSSRARRQSGRSEAPKARSARPTAWSTSKWLTSRQVGKRQRSSARRSFRGSPSTSPMGPGRSALFPDPSGHPMGMYSRTLIAPEKPAGT